MSSYTVLARRYRSATFDDIIGQAHVAQTIKKAIATNRLAHAYLFCGTRGTGKTSMARILAKTINCQNPKTQPCNTCASCTAIAGGQDMDVIEIDAASHTGVENVRELIENAQYRPVRGRYKVYIIDEVHMLSKAAMNSLLKTLEEPPEHVKFILATTEADKVLATIQSRCQRFDFHNISTRDIAGHLADICKKEKVPADADALLLVAKSGAGSMRDALSVLDRLLSVGPARLTSQMVQDLLGLPKTQLVFNLADCIGKGDVKALLTNLDQIIAAGLSAETLVGALIDHLRNLLVLRTCGADSELVEAAGMPTADLEKQAQRFEPVLLLQDIAILEELRRHLRQAHAGRALLEATLARLALAEQFVPLAELLASDAPAGTVTAPKKKLAVSEPSTPEAAPRAVAKVAPPPAQVPEAQPVRAEVGEAGEAWPTLLGQLPPALSAVLSQGQYVAPQDGVAILRFAATQATFARLLEKPEKMEPVRAGLSALLGRPTGIRIEVSAAQVPSTATINAPAARAAAPVSTPSAPVANNGRVSAEQKAALAEDPLIKAVLQDLGGQVVRIE